MPRIEINIRTGLVTEHEDAPLIPVSEPSNLEKLRQLDAENMLTQRNLREFILLTVQAVKQLNPALDLSVIPGVAKVVEVEAQAEALRAQL